MASRSNGAIRRKIQTLYDVGVIGDLTDAQLMERFTTLDREAAELAFAALVERHGPMVLRVCQNLLNNPQDAEDACQATFFILVRKARFVWVRDSLAPWLHRVAVRVASRARASALRRREHERRAAELKLRVVHDDDNAEGLLGLLHAEIDRLPEKYRAAVVVCDMEGLSHERAARQLGWPVGTVKSRLARARQLLRTRLTARGLAAPTILALTDAATSSVDAAVSLPMVNSTLRAVLLAAKAPTIGVISVGLVNLAEEVLKTMFLTKLKLTWAGVLIACALTAATAAVLGRQYDGSTPNSATDRPDAKRVHFASRAGEPHSSSAPDFIKQSRGMIMTRLEQELALARARLDRTLRRVVSPDDPAVLQARRTVDEIEGLLARIDGVLVDAVDRFPTIFDFSGGQGDPPSSNGKPGNGQANNSRHQASGQNAHPSGANKDGAKGQGNAQPSNRKPGDGQPDSSGSNNGSGAQGTRDNPSSSSKAGHPQSNDPQQIRDKSAQTQHPINGNGQRQSEDREQRPVQSQKQHPEQNQQPNGNRNSQQSASQNQQPSGNQHQPRNANFKGDRGYKANKHKSTGIDGIVDVDLVVSESKRVLDVGGQTTFQIRLRNYGTNDAAHLLIRAILSPNLKYLKAGGGTQEVRVHLDDQENGVKFDGIDKLGSGKEIILGLTARVTGPGPKLATCRVSVTHDHMPDGYKLEDMAGVKVTYSRRAVTPAGSP